MASFKELYAKFRHELQESWQTAEVTAHFGPTSTLDDMFRYLWCLPETFQRLAPPAGDPRISRKGAAEAERFRNEGNRFYREQKFDKALLAYNYSILAAPQPPAAASEASATPDHECLALGYANRSALLLQSGQFEAALEDIERALASGYPASRAHRLLERRAKCLLAMDKGQEARKCLEEAVSLLAGLSLSEKEKASTRGALAKLLAKCDAKGQSGGATRHDERLFYTGASAPPDVPTPRPDAACMSAAVRVAYTPVRGRHLVADRDILPGISGLPLRRHSLHAPRAVSCSIALSMPFEATCHIVSDLMNPFTNTIYLSASLLLCTAPCSNNMQQIALLSPASGCSFRYCKTVLHKHVDMLQI